MEDLMLEKKTLKTDDGDIVYFMQRGAPAQPTILLLHGLSSNHTTWRAAISDFAKAGYGVIAPDLRGHGFSGKTRKRGLYHISQTAKDLKGILLQEGIPAAHVLGYSYGGYAALELISQSPASVASVTLVSTNYVNPFVYRGCGFLAVPARFLIELVGYLCIWQSRKAYYYYDQDAAQNYWQSTFSGFLTMPLSINMWMLSEAFRVHFRKTLAAIRCPTLFVYSSGDFFITKQEVDDMARLVRGSEVYIVDHSSHFIASEFQDKLVERVLRFLRTHV